MRVFLVSMVMLLASCGQSQDESQPAQPRPAESAAQLDPTPAPAEPAEPPAPPGCTLSPAGGVLLTTARKRARPVVGESSVAVVHRPRRRFEKLNFDCETRPMVQLAPFPLDASTVEEISDSCVGGQVIARDLIRLEGDLALAQCVGSGSTVECGVRWLHPEEGQPQWREGGLMIDQPWVIAADRSGDTLFGALLTPADGTVLTFAATAGSEPQRGRLGTLPEALRDDESYDRILLTVDANSATEAVVHFGGKTRGTVMRGTIGADGRRTGAPERVDRPGPTTPFAIEAARESRRATPHLRLSAGGAEGRPIGGVDETIGTFGPSFVQQGERWILAWSQGMNTETRVQVAVLDASTGAIVGPVTQVSTGDREGGYASVDAYGEHAVVAWDEKNGETWEIRAAELSCN